MSRIAARFEKLRAEGRAGLVIFLTAGDPDPAASAAIIEGLPQAGADLIEIGMPFTDPMADGPAIQAANLRALASGVTLAKTLGMVEKLRAKDNATPVVLMGYYNPIYAMGVSTFLERAGKAGVDGLIIVDMPPEEADELGQPARKAGIDFIALATPTSDDARLPTILEKASGFLYYVSVAGVTGTRSAASSDVASAVERLRRFTKLPVAVGFGIRTPEQAAATARHADAAVVGSAVVQKIADGLDANGRAVPGLAASVLSFVAELAQGVRAARR